MKNDSNLSQPRIDFLIRILNIVATHFEAQRRFGNDPKASGCCNLAILDDGTEVMCAVGALMPSALRKAKPAGSIDALSYDERGSIHDGYIVSGVGEYLHAECHILTREAWTKFLEALQNLHDHCYANCKVMGCDEHRVLGFVLILRWLVERIEIVDSFEQLVHGAEYHFNPNAARDTEKLARAIREYAVRR
jgi:hypothetical protein